MVSDKKHPLLDHPLLDRYFNQPWMPSLPISSYEIGPAEVSAAEATIDIGRLRYAQPGDTPRLAYLGDLIWRGKMGQTASTIAYQVDDMFRTGQSQWFVMELGREIVGFAGVRQSWIAPSAAEMIGVNVHPNHQGKGIGKVLTEVRLELLKALGKQYVQIATIRPDFFDLFGFKDIDVTPDHWVVMRHIIDPNRRYFRGI